MELEYFPGSYKCHNCHCPLAEIRLNVYLVFFSFDFTGKWVFVGGEMEIFKCSMK